MLVWFNLTMDSDVDGQAPLVFIFLGSCLIEP